MCNNSDPFGLCSTGQCLQEALRQIGRLVRPIETPVAVASAIVLAPIVLEGITVAASGAALSAPASAASGAEVAGMAEPTAATMRHFGKQLAEHGAKSLAKSIRSLTKQLAEHEEKLAEIVRAGRDGRTVEAEIEAFKQQIEAAKRVLQEAAKK